MRCVLKHVRGKFKFRRGGVKCRPSKAARARHKKLHGKSGGKAHKEHARREYERRVANIKRARVGKLDKRARSDFNSATRINTKTRF